jgi:hypothetical protein
MTPAWSQIYRLTIILIIFIGLLTGCASIVRDFEDRMNRMRFPSDHASFENALSVYKAGDYEQAMNLFRTLSTTRTHEKLARRAWLGEICCSLMLADTPADYAAAIAHWHEFGKSAPENGDVWDMALLDPLIARLTPQNTARVSKIDLPAAQVSGETTESADRRQSNLQHPPEFSALEKKSAQAARLQRRLDAVVAENLSLKKKIKALEAIDQDIQKKKTEMVAPSE